MLSFSNFSFLATILKYRTSYSINAQSTGIILISKPVWHDLQILSLQIIRHDFVGDVHSHTSGHIVDGGNGVFWRGYLCAGCRRNAFESPRSIRRAFFASSARKTRTRLGAHCSFLDQKAHGFENTFFGRRRLNKSCPFSDRGRCCVDATNGDSVLLRSANTRNAIMTGAKWHSNEWTGGHHTIGLPCCLLLPLSSVSHHVMRLVLASFVRCCASIAVTVWRNTVVYNRIITRRAYMRSAGQEINNSKKKKKTEQRTTIARL